MRSVFLSFVFLPLAIFNFGFAQAKSEIYTETHTEATGNDASVHTEITNIVNQKEVKVESDKPGEIKVEVKNGEVKIESSPEASPTVITSDSGEGEETETAVSRVEQIQKKIFSYLENFFSHLRKTLFFWRRS